MEGDGGYRERWGTASFRRFQFKTDSHDGKYGRRLVIKEFPGSDEPLVQDLGSKAQGWQLNAYFIGPDYDLERNGFLAKLANPGADWLIHPWLGLLWVRAHNWSVSETNAQGGFCTVRIEFVAGGQAPFAPVVDKVDTALVKLAKAKNAVVAAHKPPVGSARALAKLGAQASGLLAQARNYLNMARMPLAWAQEVANVVNGIKADIATLMALPSDYAKALAGLADVLGLGTASAATALPTQHAAQAVRMGGLAAAAAPGSAALADALQSVVAAKEREAVVAEFALRQRLYAVAAAQAALTDYASGVQRNAALGAALLALEGVLPQAPAEVFEAVCELREALIVALMAQNLAAAQSLRVLNPLPAVVLAQRLGVTEAQLLERTRDGGNATAHPLFVRGQIYA